ncbi:YhdP family protein [Paraglaciecola marina]|uniref:YhdP family protein n=1 Tax=Paraglaciecola marina TaxID=2500157 RepID=UPI0010600062|nr:YhdP family protein [Paraglaciecola marina]
MKTNQKSASFYVAYILKKLWGLAALCLVLVAVCLTLLRYSLPYMNEQKHHLEDWLSERVGAELTIAEISAQWRGLGPAIVLRNIELTQNQQSPVSLLIDETAIEVDFWQSILAMQIKSNEFDLRNMQLSLDLTTLKTGKSDYPIVEALEELFLQQLQSFSVSDSKIILNTLKGQQVVLIDQVSWLNREEHHQGRGQLQIEEIAKNSASFVLDLYGKSSEIYGTFFAEGEEVDLSPWVQQWVTSKHELVESRGSFVMWADIQNKAIQSVQLDLSNSRFAWQTPQGSQPSKTLEANVLQGQINGSPINDDWVFNFDNLTLQVNDQVSVSNWKGKIDAQGTASIQHLTPLKLDTLLPMLALSLKHQDMLRLEKIQPDATLNNLSIQRTLNGNLTIHAAISDISWQQNNYLPGVSGLDADFNWNNDSGKVSIKSKSGTLFIDNLLPENIDYQRFHADLHIQKSSEGIQFDTDNAVFKSELITLNPDFSFNTMDGYLAFKSTIDTMHVEALTQLYPTEKMGKKTRAYLVNAIQDGKINNAQLLWHGVLTDFPFTDNQGVFQAQFDVTDGQFKFAPQWPALSNISANLLFTNESLTIKSKQANLMDAALVDLSASIPSFTQNATLTIAAKAKATGQEASLLISQSNLASTLGKVLQQVIVEGPVTTDLDLNIPLTGKNIVAKGAVNLLGNDVTIPNLNLSLSESQGQLTFVNDKINIEKIDALLFKQPISLTLSGDQQTSGYHTNIDITGNCKVTPILEEYHPQLANYLSGTGEWQANVALTIPSQGFQFTAKLSSDLMAVQSSLPKPFAKQAEQALPLIITSEGNQQASTIKLTLGEEIEFNGILPHQDKQFSRAHLSIGKSDLVGMGLGFSISADVAEFDATPWLNTMQTLLSEKSTSDHKPILEAPKRIFINADIATFSSQQLTDFEVVAKNNTDSWLLDINAKQARMDIALHKDWLEQGIDINADFIALDTWQSAAASEDPPTNTVAIEDSIDSLPPINFSCLRCSFMENNLGKIDLKLSRAATGMKIDDIRVDNDHGLFFGTGDWFITGGKSSTRLQGEFNSSDFGALLKGFKVNSGVKDSKAQSTFDLSWQKAPYEFNFDTLNGQIDWSLSDGYITEITDKGSRIFSILSFESLVRKLKLDFRDVFAKGFFYDEINGSFQIHDGIADTRDTVVDGGAGEIIMKGYTDLTARELNYNIEFTPKITSSLPVIVAWMVNPATAIAALAIDQMLTSAKVISNINFSLTGTIDEPVITELGRDSREVALPAQKVPESLQPVDQELDIPTDINMPEEEPISE